MIEIRRGMSGDEFPTVSDVTAEDIEHYLDPNAKGVPELKPNEWLKKETARLEALIAGEDPRERALAQAELAMYLERRDTERAKLLATEAHAAGERLADSSVIAFAQCSLGRGVFSYEYELRKSGAYFLEAEYLFNDLGNRIQEAEAMLSRMGEAWLSGSVSTAAELEGPIVELLRAPGDERDEYTRLCAFSNLNHFLAWIAWEAKKDLDLCRRFLVLAVAFARAAPEPLLVGQAHHSLGFYLLEAKDYAAARPHFARYGFIARKNGSSTAEIIALGNLSETYAGERDFAAAQDAIDEADEIIARTPHVSQLSRLIVDGARIWLLMAQELWDEAETLLTKVMPEIERSPRRNTIVILKFLITVYRAKGTLHEHLDVYDRLIEEIERFADERGAMQLGAAETHRETQRRKEEKRTDKLLRGLLPGAAYAELVQSGESTPRYYPDAVVFFSDFVGFTKIAAALTPRQVIEELSDLFASFDSIMTAHGCERIETIGDAYLAVAGLNTESSNSVDSADRKRDNAVRMAGAAIEIQEYLLERNKNAGEVGGSQFVARIGLHDGPIIGGIVGRERIRYGIFGDAVNTAQRLETACDPGGICISQSMHEILSGAPGGSAFEITPHGEITLKGKGAMNVWYLWRAGTP